LHQHNSVFEKSRIGLEITVLPLRLACRNKAEERSSGIPVLFRIRRYIVSI
jgi:hypothetical protein